MPATTPITSGNRAIRSSKRLAAASIPSSSLGATTPGDDTYHIWQSSDQVVEAPGGGVDTVIIAWRDYTLPDNVENLIFSNAKSGTGNSLNNMITGDGGAQTLNGKAGNDILTGRGGADIFVIAKGEGSDVITDFTSGVDKVRMEGVNLHSFAELKMAASQVGSDTVIALGGGETLTLQNVALTNLKAGDFVRSGRTPSSRSAAARR
ncbi:hypothetical protein ASF60_19840 [Methylobacterium sp. Leaf113]|nr:hypothetical protein ASF60_19840 [Methylobacterium sp. Leaf113]